MGRMADKRLFLLDMDGTIYLDDRLFDGTLDFLAWVRAVGGRALYLTNNSSRGVSAYVEKLARSPRPGSAGCRRPPVVQIAEAGLPVTDRLEEGIDCLCCGFDTELTFQKLEDACILLNRGVDFAATNPDWVCPTWYGSVPDCGSVCRMLTTATGRTPRFLGKPRPDMVYLSMARTGFAPAQTVLLGDRLYTDIACGVNAGIDTVFVLSGEGTEADIEKFGVHPTWVRRDIAELLQELQKMEE